SIIPSGYMNTSTVFHRLSALADATRGRLLYVLDGRELTVGELVAAVQLPQSTVSRHLRILSDEGWLASRSEGTSRYYAVSPRLDPGAEELWRVVRESLSESAEAGQDVERARELVSRRRTRSQEFFSTAAGQWDAMRRELFGAPEARALLALMDPAWTVGDLGCGTGRLAETVAPFVARVIAVDESPDMLEAARRRLADEERVELRAGRLEALPVEDASLDVALLGLVLHHVADPARALAEAARVLRIGGRLLVVDMVAHGREEYRERMGHVWQGFERSRLEGWLREAGFDRLGWHPLPADTEAKGPLLFTAVATRVERPR
ncbi:MAG: metalloregulator ArsR/SmtB family transcription factor, partial [Gemmatimonadetes bacterium]|nr:metalloregulator ArsR/SmtB family transcription factor [Gemmatimonadota bacterium]